MDYVIFCETDAVHRGLVEMMNAAGEMGSLIEDTKMADISIVLLVIEISKIADDKDEWFPRGKWATIQFMQNRCDRELKKLSLALRLKRRMICMKE